MARKLSDKEWEQRHNMRAVFISPNNSNRQALADIGGLSKPAKMPCNSYSLPASACGVGCKLQQVRGSACFKCYAKGGFYMLDSTVNAMDRRLAIVREAITNPVSGMLWVENFVTVLTSTRKPLRVFRWHDSGDVQSVEHIRLICEIAKRLPRVRFWIPTRERNMFRSYLATGGTIPENLTVRFSDPMIDAPAGARFLDCPTSGIHTPGHVPDGIKCMAPRQGGYCVSCRACWNPTVSHVSYLLH